MPVASIIIPCYNASLYISQTIDSACKQTEQDLYNSIFYSSTFLFLFFLMERAKAIHARAFLKRNVSVS